MAPACDLVDRSAAAEAEAGAGIEGADFDARGLDHGLARAESDATLSVAFGKAIA